MVDVTSSDLLPFGSNALARSDDATSPPIDITSIFQDGITIGGVNYRQLYVNSNGNVTFDGGLTQSTPDAIGFETGPLAIIAPFWADVDTRGTTDVAKNVFWDYNFDRDSIVVTWNDVGYYNANQDAENTFQLELADTGGGNVQIIFRYTDINWTTGDLSGGLFGLGGTVARAGFSFGDALSYELPASGDQNAILTLEDDTGNTGVQGAWLFDIRGDQLVESGTSGNDNIFGDNTGETIFAEGGDDFIDGLGGNDFLYGGEGRDEILGGLGDDLLNGGLGSDTLNGGEGFDTADYAEYGYNPAAYALNGDGSVSIRVSTNEVDTLFGIEAVAFRDGDLRFDAGYFENFGAAYRFYTSILNREPDGAGLDFYVSLLDRGVSLFTIAEDISTSDEFIQNFGDNLGTLDFLDRVYQNILDRTPDQAGLTFWSNAINTGEVTRSEALVYISEDTENLGSTIGLIGNGYFVEDFGFGTA